jgi:hypothetical protein
VVTSRSIFRGQNKRCYGLPPRLTFTLLSRQCTRAAVFFGNMPVEADKTGSSRGTTGSSEYLSGSGDSFSWENVLAGLGIFLVCVCGVAGSLDAWLLTGVSICGFPLTPEIVKFAAVTALFPAAAVLLFRGQWWIPPSVFVAPLNFSALFGIVSGEWPRFYAPVGCMTIAFASAWLLRPRKK